MVQTNWTSLGRPASVMTFGTPQVLQNADGRLEVFLNGSDQNLWHIWQTAPGNGWSDWASLKNTINPSFSLIPVPGRNADGRIEVFTTGADGALWHIWQTAPNNGWSDWFSSGKPSSSVGNLGVPTSVEINTNGRLEVFTCGTDGALWHLYQLAPNGNWGSWTSLEKPPNTKVNALGTGKNADGRIEVFTIGDDGNLWHIWQTTPGGSWSNWFSSGKPVNGFSGSSLPPTVSRNLDGRLEVFAIGSDGALYHIWQHTPDGTWGDWFWLDKPTTAAILGSCSVAQNKDGHLELMVNGDDGALWHIWQTDGGKNWGMWYSLGMPASTTRSNEPFVIANADGRLEAFTSGSDGALWHTWQVTPGGNWG